MKTFTSIGILAMFLAVGCADSTDLEQPGGQWEFEQNNETATLGCVPESEPVWSQAENEPWYSPGRIGFSQNDGLFSMSSDWLGGKKMIRTHDGATFGLPGYGRLDALDKSWDLVADASDAEGPVRVVRRSTGETVLDMVPERSGASVVATEIAASGRAAVALTCKEGQLRLLRWSLQDGRQTHGVSIGVQREYCNTWNRRGEQIAVGPAENFVMVAMRETGELIRVDLGTGEVTQGRVEVADEGDVTPRAANTVILDTHLDANGQRVLLSTASGRVEVRRLPGFERIASFDAGVTLLNEMTYAPRVLSSPVAWAPSGRRFVSVSDEGDAILRNLDGEILQTFPGAVADPNHIWGMEDVPVAIGFSHDGTRLAIGHYFGSAMYACEGAAFPRSEQSFDEDVSIDGPSQVQSREGYEWVVNVDGHRGAVKRFLVDGERVPMRSESVLNWRAYEPGVYELTAEVDDGRAMGRATMTVTVE